MKVFGRENEGEVDGHVKVSRLQVKNWENGNDGNAWGPRTVGMTSFYVS